MRFEERYVDFFENKSVQAAAPLPYARILPGSRIIKTTILGPLYMNRNSQLGPDTIVGKYFGLNESCFAARCDIGAYCAIGARCAINPFNHPTSWLSIHEFQYHPNSYDWVPEYANLKRLPRTPDMFSHVSIGNDVWMGHNVNVLAGLTIGDGAVIAAGSVVTKNVPPYGIVAGVPATLKRLRFPEETVERLLRVKWWDLELEQLSGLPFRDVELCLDALEEIRADKALVT
jgi:acetyltransferase-like isoleucine patch superfamily enzyme